MEPVSKAELLEKWSNPVKFFAYCNGSLPYDYQVKMLEDESDRVIWNSGRQVGKSTTIAIKALYHVMQRPDRLAAIISASERQSREIVYRIRQILMNQPTLKEFINAESATAIVLSNGSRILSLPPGAIGKTVKGFSITLLIFDEAAVISDAAFDALMPSVIRTHGKVVMTSTPFGQRGKFFQAYNSPHFSKHHTTTYDCPDVDPKDLQIMRDQMTEKEYLQNYEGVFVSDVGGFFNRDSIINAVMDGIETDFPAQKRYFCGVDLARYGLDETVYTIVEAQGDGSFRVVKIIATSKLPLTDSIGRIKHLHFVWNFERIYIDETGLGGGPVDLIKESNLPMSPITFTLENKTKMYQNLQYLFENLKLKIPRNEKLISQLVQLEGEFTSNQMLKIHHPEGGHDDYPSALALACFASTKPTPFMGIRGARGW
jgi:hypothetical protein